jgi:tetratricopeptide (TPR) repeat protein
MGQILKNGMLKSWHTFIGSLGAHVWKDLYPFAVGNYYRPVFVSWLFINRLAFGFTPFWWHLTTVLMHAAACLLVFRISRKIGLALYPAAFCALLFGIHPVHVESAAWVSGVTDSLMAVPLLSSYLFYLHWKESGRRTWLLGSWLLFAVSLLAKETAVVLPVIVLADVWIDAGSRTFDVLKRTLVAGASMLVLVGGYLGLRWAVLGSLGHSTIRLPLSAIVLTWPKLLCFYLRLLLIPVGLNAFYDIDYVYSPRNWEFLLPFVALLIVAAGVWHWQRRSQSRKIRFAIVWLVIPLLPVFNLGVFQWRDFVHDRYLYLSVLGFAVLVAAVLEKLRWPEKNLRPYWSPAAVALLLLSCLGVVSVYQSGFWTDNLSLFLRAASIAPRNCTASNNLGTAYADLGRLEEAQATYEATAQQCPNFWLAIYNLGFLNYRIGNHLQAEAYLLRAIQLDPNEGDEHMYLGMARYRMNHLPEALAEIRRAIEVRPAQPGYHFALGIILEQVPDWKAAQMAFQEEIRLNPSNSAAVQELERCRRRLAG